MAEHDPLSSLDELARIGEQHADPLPAGEVRARGNQRRRRRHTLVATAMASVVVAIGGVALSGNGPLVDERPSPAGTPRASASPSPSAARQLTTQNLITAQEVPLGANYESVAVADPGSGRRPDELSACQDGPIADLGARQVLSRNFRQDRADSPAVRDPEIYTLTLQFGDAAQASTALDRYTGWVEGCAATLDRKGYEGLGPATGGTPRRIVLDAGTGQGSAYELVYLEPGQSEQEGTFENVGLLQVKDRLLIMVRVVRGQDDNAYYWGDREVEGLQQHPFHELARVAARKLA